MLSKIQYYANLSNSKHLADSTLSLGCKTSGRIQPYDDFPNLVPRLVDKPDRPSHQYGAHRHSYSPAVSDVHITFRESKEQEALGFHRKLTNHQFKEHFHCGSANS